MLQFFLLNIYIYIYIYWKYQDIFTQKIIHEDFKIFVNFSQFFSSGSLSQNFLILPSSKIPQGAKCPNTPKSYTTNNISYASCLFFIGCTKNDFLSINAFLRITCNTNQKDFFHKKSLSWLMIICQIQYQTRLKNNRH